MYIKKAQININIYNTRIFIYNHKTLILLLKFNVSFALVFKI